MNSTLLTTPEASHTAAASGVSPRPATAEPGALSGWKKICLVSDIPVLGARRVARAQGMDVAIFRNDQNQVFALLDRCPHKGGPLSQGIVLGTRVACPLHNWTIGLADGVAQAPDEGCTPPFQVRVENDEVFLLAAELASHAIDLKAPVAGPGQQVPAPRIGRVSA